MLWGRGTLWCAHSQACAINPKPQMAKKRVVPEKYFAFFSAMAGIQSPILSLYSLPSCGLCSPKDLVQSVPHIDPRVLGFRVLGFRV